MKLGTFNMLLIITFLVFLLVLAGLTWIAFLLYQSIMLGVVVGTLFS
jgi:hypothetical protein